MKSSEYNYYTPYNQGVIFMNGISEATFWVGDNLAAAFREIIENPDLHTEYADFLDKMKTQGFVIDNDTDEKELIDQKYQQLRKPNEYRIMILPTYQCNLRCWYCVQDHENSWLTDNSIERIKNLIAKNLANPEIKTLHISWFGGEPLLAFDKILDITKYAQALTKANAKGFICGITTNGTLLTPERIDALCEAGVNGYQITIDGIKEDHDKVKVMANKSAFDIAMNNVAYLSEKANCVLRFNYTKNTFKPKQIVKEIDKRIAKSVRHNILLNLQPVWQTKKEDQVPLDKVVKMMRLAHDIGIAPSLKTCGLCYVDHKHYDCIYPSGQVGKCENGIANMKLGRINQGGDIDYSDAENFHFTSTYERGVSVCTNCRYLPFCWGPCSQKRHEMLKQKNTIQCVWPDKEAQMQELIRCKFLSNRPF